MNWKRVTSYMAALAMVFCFAGVAVAGTNDAKVQTSFTSGFAQPSAPEWSTFVISNYCDFSKLYTGTNSGVTGGDTVQLLAIPAGTFVKHVGIRIASAWSTGGATCYGVTIGDGSDTNGWLKDIDFGPTASGTSVSSGVSSVSANAAWPEAGDYMIPGGKYYSTADTIDAIIPIVQRTTGVAGAVSAASDLKLQVWAECYKPNTRMNYNQNPPVR